VDVEQVIFWLRRLVDLDTRVFDEVRSNPNATIPGVIIVAVSTFIAGIGGWLWWLLRDFGSSSDIFIHSAVIGSAIAVVLWGLVWLGIVYVVLTQIFGARAYGEQLLRVMGLAAAPLALMGFMFIPGVALAVGMVSLALTFTLTNAAIQSVTNATPSRVLLANLTGFFVWSAALTLFASASISSLEPHAPGVFLFNATTSITKDFLDIGRTIQDFLQ
jgi:hypothetical protein